MSVIGRVWRRAPKFRLLVAFAVTTSALATFFPPPLPVRHGAAPKATTAPPPPHYAPPKPAQPAEYTDVDLPPLVKPRSQMISFAGRQVPLPAGQWMELVVARSRSAIGLQAAIFARMQNGALSGLMMVLGTPAVMQVDLRDQTYSGCANPLGLPMHDLSPRDGDLAAKECWMTHDLDVTGLRSDRTKDPLVSQALDRLNTIGVSVPEHAVVARYARANDAGALDVRLFLPEAPEMRTAHAPRAAQAIRHADQWMQRWVPLLHKGFDGRLAASDITPALAHDPSAPG